MLIYFLILLGAVLRVMPHPGNFAPIAALALFGAVYIKDKRLALIVPLAAMAISDIFIGFDSFSSRLIIYSSFLFIGLIGLWVRNHKNIFTVVGGTVLGSVLFYLITNLVWLYPAKMYPHTFDGQILSYTNALPFFRYTLLGDLFYVALFFSLYELVCLYELKYKQDLRTSESKKLA
jgi:hypothetical protein